MATKNLLTNVSMENLTSELKKTFAYQEDVQALRQELQQEIATQIGTTYRAAGNCTFAELPELTAANLGKVYNVTDDFTTTADFVDGAGKHFGAGADVGVVEFEAATSVSDAVYKYNVFGDFVDTSGKADKVTNGTTGALLKQDASGNLADTGIDANDVVTKVTGATSGNFAGLDANGKLTDTGKKPADYVERVFVEGTEDAVIHESDIVDYTAAQIATMLAKGSTSGNGGE